MDDLLPIPDEFKNDQNKNINRDELLESFLNDLTKLKEESHTQPSGFPVHYSYELAHLSPEDYPVIELPAETQDKIARLQTVIAEVEKRNLNFAIPSSLNKEYKIDYLRSLNPKQLIAVLSINGPVLVIAGAGSGKTRVIVYRVSYLIENGIYPEEILLLTFTRKAAKQMLNRVEQLLLDKNVAKVHGGTFHSFANHLLRKYSNLLNIRNNFTIIDNEDAADTIDLLRTELKFNKTDKAFPKKHRIQEIISSARNRNLTNRDVIEKEFTGILKYCDDIELISRGFAKYKQICNIFDYDDLLEFLRNALRDNILFRQKAQAEYKYIMVDEFQDTNIIQKEIVDMMAGGHRNVMVVGDDAQSIYAFRGANFENILRFPETYPDCKVIKVEENYRSNQSLLDFSNAVIHSAKLGYRKVLYTKNFAIWKPIIKKFFSQENEADYIVTKVLELRERGISLGEVAVLCRAVWHSRYIELELAKRGIPYVVVGGIAFIERMHVKDVLAFLRILLNPFDAVAWHRILKLFTGVGKVSAAGIVKLINDNNGQINFNEFSNKKFFKELHELELMLKEANQPQISVASKIEIIRDFYVPYLKAKESDYQIRLLDINVLIDLAKTYTELEKFLTEFLLEPPSNKFTGKSVPLIDENEEKPLTISTVHSAKGLEWYAVFIVHALDGLFPSNRALKSFEEIEEERRLFYVASSRAKEQLYITMPSYIQSWDGFFSYPSRFLVDIDKDKYEYVS